MGDAEGSFGFPHLNPAAGHASREALATVVAGLLKPDEWNGTPDGAALSAALRKVADGKERVSDHAIGDLLRALAGALTGGSSDGYRLELRRLRRGRPPGGRAKEDRDAEIGLFFADAIEANGYESALKSTCTEFAISEGKAKEAHAKLQQDMKADERFVRRLASALARGEKLSCQNIRRFF